MKNENVTLLPPADSLRNIMSAFFGQDSDVTVLLNDEDKSFNIIMGGCEAKAEAMRIALSGDFQLAGQTYKLLVNGKSKSFKTIVTADIIRAAFAGNKVFDSIYIKTSEDGKIDKWAMLMKNVVVQFPNDNGNSPFGFETHSAEDLARMALVGKLDCAMLIASVSSVGDNGYWNK